MPWDKRYVKQAEKSAGGDWPDIPDDLYDAMVRDVSEPETKPDIYKPGEERTDFYVTWEFEADGQTVSLRQYVGLPATYLSDGFLNEKSNLYKLMEALGFDMDGRFGVDPESWQGMEARVMVENKANAQGDIRPRITAVKPKRGARGAGSRQPNGAPPRQPVGAGAGRGSAKEDNWDND